MTTGDPTLVYPTTSGFHTTTFRLCCVNPRPVSLKNVRLMTLTTVANVHPLEEVADLVEGIYRPEGFELGIDERPDHPNVGRSLFEMVTDEGIYRFRIYLPGLLDRRLLISPSCCVA